MTKLVNLSISVNFVIMDNKNLIDKFVKMGILSYRCSEKCESDIKLVVRKRNENGNELLSLRCSNGKCQKYRSLCSGSFFSLFKKRMQLINEAIKL